MELERHMQHLYRGPFRRGGPVLMSASAGIDMALCECLCLVCQRGAEKCPFIYMSGRGNAVVASFMPKLCRRA